MTTPYQDELNEWQMRAEAAEDELRVEKDAVKDLEREVERLRLHVWTYGNHKFGCSLSICGHCTCGLAEIWQNLFSPAPSPQAPDPARANVVNPIDATSPNGAVDFSTPTWDEPVD